MYLVRCKENSREVEFIIKDPNQKQIDIGGYLIENLTDEHQFTKVDDKLYYIKEND